MNIGGFLKNSFIDYPGKISAVIFTSGCNFKCWYCHNRELINSQSNDYDKSKIMEFLKSRTNFLDAVVISGGEPTLQSDLIETIKEIKGLGFLIKLDTNGTNPKMLKTIIENSLVDYVAMDIKTSLDKYESIVKTKVDISAIKESIKILVEGNVDYEFRTTYSPDISINDIESLCNDIRGAKKYYLQHYIQQKEDELKSTLLIEDFERAKDIALKYVKKCELRGF